MCIHKYILSVQMDTYIDIVVSFWNLVCIRPLLSYPPVQLMRFVTHQVTPLLFLGNCFSSCVQVSRLNSQIESIALCPLPRNPWEGFLRDPNPKCEFFSFFMSISLLVNRAPVTNCLDNESRAIVMIKLVKETSQKRLLEYST